MNAHPKNNKRKSRIEQLPEETRKIILVSSLIVLGTIIFSFWLISLKTTLNTIPQQKEKSAELENLQKNFSEILQQVKTQMETIENNLSELASSSPGQQLMLWQIYQNKKGGYQISYPQKLIEPLTGEPVKEMEEKDSPYFKIKTGGEFTIGIWDKAPQLTVRQWLDEYYAGFGGGWSGKFEETQIGNLKAFITYQPADCYLEWVLIPDELKIYTIKLEICGGYQDSVIQLFRSVASTFRLLPKTHL